MIPLAFGAALSWGVAEAWSRIPYSHSYAKVGSWKVTRYTTILTTGVTARGRIAGRLYACDFWREHDRTARER